MSTRLASLVRLTLFICFTPQLTSVSSDAHRSTTLSNPRLSESGQDHEWNKGITEWNVDMFAQEKPREPQYPFSSPFSQGSSQQSPGQPRFTSLSTITEHSLSSAEGIPDTGKLLHSYPPLSPKYDPTSHQGVVQYIDFPATPPTVQSTQNPFRGRLLAASSKNGIWS